MGAGRGPEPGAPDVVGSLLGAGPRQVGLAAPPSCRRLLLPVPL